MLSPDRQGQAQRFLDLNQPDDFIQALARVVRLAQADYHSGHYTTQPDGHLRKHRDRTPLKIMVLKRTLSEAVRPWIGVLADSL
jgi:hypothetical protein